VIALVIAASAVSLAPARATGPLHLDGRLDEAAWAAATPFAAFVQKNPDAGGPPSEPTTARFLVTEDALWVGVDCVQQKSRIVARLTRRDREIDSDRVELDLDTRGRGREAFHFEVNAAGVLVDALRYDDTEINPDWDENWEAVAARTEHGWSAELRIPLRILRYPDRDGQRWGVQVRRFVSARQETDELAAIPRGEAGEVSRYAQLGPLDGLPGASSVELRPFALSSVARDVTGTYTPTWSAGGDLKWHLTPSLTFDATVNPDFAQVEADQVVLNLTTYETFYPEKRPFFLEGVDLFAAPIMMLYTRRIGRVPDAPVLPDGEAATASPRPARIWGAAKLTGTVGDDTSIGALAAITGADTVETRDATSTYQRLAEPWSAFGVLRVRHGLGERGYVGAFGTAVARFDDTGGDPVVGGNTLCADGSIVAIGARCTHDAVVGGADAQWRSPGGAYVLGADVAASAIHGGPPRPQRDGIVIASGDVSPQAQLTAAKQDHGFVFETVAEAYGRRFDLNDLGYLTRANYRHLDLNVGWKDVEPGKLIRDSVSYLEVFGSENWRGERLSGGVQLNTQITFASYWTMFTELHYRPWHFDDREIGDGTALERSGQLGWELSLGTDPRRDVVASWSQSAYLHPQGLEYSGEGDLTLHALPQLDVELLPSVLRVHGQQRYVETLADGTRSFGRQDALGAGVTLRTTYTFTPRATLQLYGQIFGESVAYSDFSTAPAGAQEIRLFQLTPSGAPPGDVDTSSTIVNASAVFRWEWRLGSLLYVVYSRSQGADRAFAGMVGAPIPWADGARAPAVQALLVKVSYWWG
jgi:hypothetical protein